MKHRNLDRVMQGGSGKEACEPLTQRRTETKRNTLAGVDDGAGGEPPWQRRVLGGDRDLPARLPHELANELLRQPEAVHLHPERKVATLID